MSTKGRQKEVVLMPALLDKRKEKKWTQEKMAKRLGLSRQYYNALENSTKQPSVELAKKISDILELDDWTVFFK